MKAMKRLRIFNYIVIIQILFSGLIEMSVAKRNAGEFVRNDFSFDNETRTFEVKN